MGGQIVSVIPLNYLLEKLDEGFGLDFVIRDSGVKRDSLMRRFERAKNKGLLNDRHIFLIWGNKE